jgi:hypothetical protein
MAASNPNAEEPQRQCSFFGKFSPVPYLILELATNTPRIFSKKLDEIAKSISEIY